MNFKNIFTIYTKELRDMLRDRRTLISMVVIPTLAMPALFAVVMAVAFRIQSEVAATLPTIMILGGDDSATMATALRAHAGYRVLPTSNNWRQLIADKQLRAVVAVPAGFEAAVQRGESAEIKIYYYEGEVRSDRAVREVRGFINSEREKIVAARLAAHGLGPAAIRPIEIRAENVAPPEKVGGNLIGGVIPYFFLLMAFSGAMYPAMDLTAGEKERGTMATLLCSPVGRIDIVLGKFFMILTASLGTVTFSLLSLAATFSVGGAFVAQRIAGTSPAASTRAADKFAEMTSLDPGGLLAVVVMVLPMVVLFAAVLFAISLFAKSFKEAQSYVSPLIVVIVMPGVIGLLPGVELNVRLALVPILNVSLASKELVSGVWHWDLLALIFASTCVYAALALGAAVKMFNREDVIFRM